jgi:nucleotide-binding universal stress UspA family protein
MSIVAAVDFSKHSEQVIRAAAREARVRSVPLVVLHCVEVGGGGVLAADRETDRVEQQMRSDAHDELKRAVDQALPADERPATLEFDVTVTRPEEGIIDIALAREASLVVVGRSEPQGIGSVMWGTTAERLVGAVTRPLMVVPPGWRGDRVDDILVPVVDSKEGQKSVEMAASLARREGADVRLLNVVEIGATSTLGRDIPPSGERLASMKNDSVRRVREMADGVDFGGSDVEAVAEVCPLESAGVHEVILEAAQEWGADRLLMVTRGHEGLKRWLEGSVTSEVLHRASMPLIVGNLDETGG